MRHGEGRESSPYVGMNLVKPSVELFIRVMRIRTWRLQSTKAPRNSSPLSDPEYRHFDLDTSSWIEEYLYSAMSRTSWHSYIQYK